MTVIALTDAGRASLSDTAKKRTRDLITKRFAAEAKTEFAGSALTESLDGEQVPAWAPWNPETTTVIEAERVKLIKVTAAFRGVHGSEMEKQFHAYADQYRDLPEDERPVPPAEWLAAKVPGHPGYKTLKAKDPASIWAAYRCQSDPDGISGDAHYASIDLETSGPSDNRAFMPKFGAIIEVGIVVYDRHGDEVERYESLIRPSDEAANRVNEDGTLQGTGAVDIHNITMDDVKDAPDWETISPEIKRMMSGRVTLAQNSPFENTWLEHHMGEENFDKGRGMSDTLVVARNNFVLENHKLSTICEKVGVEYTNGHRAMHDAEVAAHAFFAMHNLFEEEYRARDYGLNQPRW